MEAARRIVELAEAFADGEATVDELQAANDEAFFANIDDRWHGLLEPRLSVLAFDAILAARTLASLTFNPSDAGIVAEWTAKDQSEDFFRTPAERGRPIGIPVDEKQRAELSKIQRDIFGNPFRQVIFDPAWRTSSVLLLANQIYESRDFSVLPFLFDALQDGGCVNQDILTHCREPGIHVRGCWVIDLILGKE
ncbi:hypothetical protein [Tuwongella immobilis]|uniref:hypothetical protein n=1 Tax=Tuwongella immobilis TaxID=692036 RepID=UPI001E61D85C|nr:hypothetical protein [Tuwongella immobilis]